MPEIKETKKEKPIINRILMMEKLSETVEMESEIYIFPKGDSVRNQYKIFENGKLDTLKSSFYEIDKFEFDGNKYNGILKFYSCYDTIRNPLKRTIEFSFIQRNKDSTFYKTYRPNLNSNEIEFEYTDFDDKSIYGHLWELIEVDTIVNGEKMVRMLENITMIDNKNPTANPFDLIDWSKK